VAPPTHLFPLPGLAEPVSSLTHLAGAVAFAAAAGPLLWRGRGDPRRVAALAVYALSCVLLLATSGVYHLLALGGAPRATLVRFDHGLIFVFIAGTFTPTQTILFRGWRCWGPLALMWIAAATGAVLKATCFAAVAGMRGLLLYIGMGWIGGTVGVVVWRRCGARVTWPLLAGGLAYTAGAACDYWHWPVVLPGVVGPHEVFHVAVLAGAALQWRFISQIASGRSGVPAPRRGRRTGSPPARREAGFANARGIANPGLHHKH
jgi:channel protein (hemolysin III family)